MRSSGKQAIKQKKTQNNNNNSLDYLAIKQNWYTSRLHSIPLKLLFMWLYVTAITSGVWKSCWGCYNLKIRKIDERKLTVTMTAVILGMLPSQMHTVVCRCLLCCYLFRLHRSTTYVDVDCCYRQSSMVCRSVAVLSLQKWLNHSRCHLGCWLG